MSDTNGAAPAGAAVVVLGAAGGIGTATVRAFLDRGAPVVGIDREPAPEGTGSTTAQATTGALPPYQHMILDATDPAALADAFADAAAAGPIGHVVTLVGGAHPDEVGATDLAGIPPAALAECIQLNLTSGLLIAQAALPHLRRTGPGASLTFTGSVNATAGIGLHVYSAAKAGLISLARTLAVAEGRHGVRVNAMLPGTVVTVRTKREQPDHVRHIEAMRESTVLGRTTSPAQAAAAFVALALDLTAVTGQALTVDAGQTARWR